MTAEQKQSKPQNLILESRSRLSVSGVEEVEGFDESYVRMTTALGPLTIHGEDLGIESLSVDIGETVITGHIAAIIYEEPSRRNGFWQRWRRNDGDKS